VPSPNLNITSDTKWKQKGITIAGGNKRGDQLNQLAYPKGIYVDDDQTIYIADTENHRIMEWKRDAKNGKVVAGGNGEGNATNQFNRPVNLILDEKSDSLIICDRINRRVVQWSRRNATEGKILISKTDCQGLAMDNNGHLYVVDIWNDEVKRWKIGDAAGITVAGGNGRGDKNSQFNKPTHIFVDQNYSVYVSDFNNHRVMKWLQNATEGIIVAGGNDDGEGVRHLNNPMGVFVDRSGHVYATDVRYDRIMRWLKGASEGSVILGGRGFGERPDQFNSPFGLTFDGEGSIYVSDAQNQRVQRFYIDPN
jgi:sugar lactone lactonase YvrE